MSCPLHLEIVALSCIPCAVPWFVSSSVYIYKAPLALEYSLLECLSSSTAILLLCVATGRS